MTEPIWIALAEVVAIHDLQLSEHGGAAGLRDLGLLESALARPQQIFAYGDPDIFSLAAAYTAGVVRKRPIVDGNKRTGFVTGVLFLELNGARLSERPPDWSGHRRQLFSQLRICDKAILILIAHCE